MSYDRVRGFIGVGMSAINVGVESGNEEFRKKELHRRPTNESVITGMSEAIRAGANIGANVIIGFPGETRDMIFESVELMRQVKERAAEHVGEKLASQRLSIMVHLFQPYSGTPMRQKAIDMGLIPKDFVCGDYRMDPQGTGFVGPEELKGLQRTFNLYVENPKDMWGEIKKGEVFFRKR
jgi:anaerobic magnesium-protoporphyrin IX monomethyl ester cyclase